MSAAGAGPAIVAALARLAARRGPWLALLAAALVLRLAVVATAPPRLIWSDGRWYESIGWSLASRGTYGMETFYPPAYPTLIAGVYTVFGRDLTAVRVTDACVSTATVGLVGAIGTWLFAPAAGLLAAAFAAFHPVFALLPITHHVENLLVFVSTLAFGSLAWAVRAPSAGRWAAAGLAYALFLLCKPTVVAMLPGLAAGAALTLARRRALRWTHAAVFVLALAAGLAPWTLRNHRVHGAWYLVGTGGGVQLWRGNSDVATGSTTWNPMPTPAMMESLAVRPDPVSKDRFFVDLAVRWMREHPRRALELYLVKLGNLWALWPNTQTDSGYRGTAQNAVMAVCSLTLYAGTVLALATGAARGLGLFPLAMLSFSLIAPWALMVMRYRMSFEVLLLWLSAAGWVAGLGRRGRPDAA